MSQYERYTSLETSSNGSVFLFNSTGPKGEIKKIVQFSPVGSLGIYNLAFGNLKNDGRIDDSTINDNKDRNKILATVAFTVFEFTVRHPENYVFFTGSSDQRTRLYRMALTVNLEELASTFDIWGLLPGSRFEPFQKRRNYHGFLIKRK